MDDFTFGRNGRDAERWWLTRATTAMNGTVIPGQSLMSMNAFYVSSTIMLTATTIMLPAELSNDPARPVFRQYLYNKYASYPD